MIDLLLRKRRPFLGRIPEGVDDAFRTIMLEVVGR